MLLDTYSHARSLAVAARRDLDDAATILRSAAETTWVSPSGDVYRHELWLALRRVHRLVDGVEVSITDLVVLDETRAATWA